MMKQAGNEMNKTQSEILKKTRIKKKAEETKRKKIKKVKEEWDTKSTLRFHKLLRFCSIVNDHGKRICLFTMILPSMIPVSPRRSDN